MNVERIGQLAANMMDSLPEAIEGDLYGAVLIAGFVNEDGQEGFAVRRTGSGAEARGLCMDAADLLGKGQAL